MKNIYCTKEEMDSYKRDHDGMPPPSQYIIIDDDTQPDENNNDDVIVNSNEDAEFIKAAEALEEKEVEAQAKVFARSDDHYNKVQDWLDFGNPRRAYDRHTADIHAAVDAVLTNDHEKCRIIDDKLIHYTPNCSCWRKNDKAMAGPEPKSVDINPQPGCSKWDPGQSLSFDSQEIEVGSKRRSTDRGDSTPVKSMRLTEDEIAEIQFLSNADDPSNSQLSPCVVKIDDVTPALLEEHCEKTAVNQHIQNTPPLSMLCCPEQTSPQYCGIKQKIPPTSRHSCGTTTSSAARSLPFIRTSSPSQKCLEEILLLPTQTRVGTSDIGGLFQTPPRQDAPSVDRCTRVGGTPPNVRSADFVVWLSRWRRGLTSKTSFSTLKRRLETTSFTCNPTETETEEMTDPQPPTKRSKGPLNCRQQFLQLLQSLCILNGRHYDDVLKTNDRLRYLETMVPPSQLESLKKTVFRQNFLRSEPSIKQKLANSSMDQVNEDRLNLLIYFFKNLCNRNNIDYRTTMEGLFKWITNSDPKFKGLILVGPTNTGKSYLLKLLSGLFDDFEVGTFQCPMSSIPSTFMFQGCINTHLYICNEMIFENLNLLQVFKEFFEGSSTLKTDQKYKDAVKLNPCPVGLTMNAESIEDAFKWAPHELPAFRNRCLFLNLFTPLGNYMEPAELCEILKCKTELFYLLNYYKPVVRTGTVNFSKYKDYMRFL